MANGLRNRSKDFIKYAKTYEEAFTESVHSISEDPLILVKEGKHLVYLENESDGKDKDEPMVFDVTTSLIEGLRGQLGVMVTYEDKNEHERLHKDMLRLENMTVVGELAASAVHEIKNPIFSIRGFLRLLENSSVDDDKWREYTQIMVSELDRLTKLVDDFLLLAKEQERKCDNVYVDKILQETISLLRPRLDLNGVTCHIEADDDLAPVFIEAGQLKQVFINVIQNALDAMTTTGDIYLKAYVKDSMVITEIQDKGIGIKKKDEGNVFKPFFTTKQNGTGLGLYICRRIVSSYGGTIEFESQEGQGTTFFIKLPIM